MAKKRSRKKSRGKSRFAGKVRANAKKQQRGASQYGYLNLPQGVSVFSPEPGSKVRLDFMPYEVTDPNHPDRDDELGIAVPGELWYKRPFKTHRNIGASNDAVVCLTSIGKRCPICEYRARRIKEGADKEETDALKPSFRNLYVVIPKGHKKYDEKPHIFDISQYLFQNLLTDELDEDERYETFPDLEEGWTVRIRFDSKTIGGSKPFAEASRIDFEERDEPYDESILDEIPNLDEVLNVLSYQQLERKFMELEDEGESSEEVLNDEDEEIVNAEEDEKVVDDDACVACEGTGRNSKGKKCRICKGTGKNPEKAESKQKDDRCPHGHVFGKDCEEYDECDECDQWDDCIDEKERLGDDIPF